MYIFAGLVLLCAIASGVMVDNDNKNGKYNTAMIVFVIMLLFSVIVGGITSKTSYKDGFEKGYQKGQVDYQKGKIEYKVEIKQVTDTIISKAN